ncbi:hypothetical protein O3M35_000237 [Rhynocoris fuscipes]|uniref:Uncharacterized protein n=1 Tax=Rhynocoris fuscipes TaxID=488301 RepID=A0AAW1DN12_9HEMI
MPTVGAEDLERLAAEELLKEADELKKFAEVEGPMAWKQKRICKTNKVFLRQTIRSAVLSNNRRKKLK